MASGASWKEQRKTSLEILRQLGLGTNVLAEKIQEEVGHFVQAMEAHQGQPADLHRLITVSVSNNICSIVFGQRFQYDDPVFIQYLENVEENMKNLGEGELLTTVSDLFIAGSETTSVAIGWTLLYFLHHPNVQDKCYKEICDVIGTERLPGIRDRGRMVYLEATINEILRVTGIVPFAAQHTTPHDVTFRGYVIPKDTIVMPFLDTVLHDPQIWGDPENFRPERFIDAEGKLVRPDEFIPFGIGRRVCLGEALARMELFLYLCTLVQHFRFLPPEPEAPPALVGNLGATHFPKPYKIRAVRRE